MPALASVLAAPVPTASVQPAAAPRRGGDPSETGGSAFVRMMEKGEKAEGVMGEEGNAARTGAPLKEADGENSQRDEDGGDGGGDATEAVAQQADVAAKLPNGDSQAEQPLTNRDAAPGASDEAPAMQTATAPDTALMEPPTEALSDPTERAKHQRSAVPPWFQPVADQPDPATSSRSAAPLQVAAPPTASLPSDAPPDPTTPRGVLVDQGPSAPSISAAPSAEKARVTPEQPSSAEAAIAAINQASLVSAQISDALNLDDFATSDSGMSEIAPIGAALGGQGGATAQRADAAPLTMTLGAGGTFARPQIEGVARMAIASMPGGVEVRLAPAELGQLQLTLGLDGDVLRVSITAERAETLDLMRRHSADLAAEFRALGYAGASFAFEQGRPGSRSPQMPAQSADEAEAASKTAPGPTAVASSVRPASGLDIRL